MQNDRSGPRRDRKRAGGPPRDRKVEHRRELGDHPSFRRDEHPDPDPVQGRGSGRSPRGSKAEGSATPGDFGVPLNHERRPLAIAEGDIGPHVADVRRRLEALGFGPISDPQEHFARATRAAVEAFQRLRGLRVDGIVGPQTWNRLVEAGFRLGDRVLYHHHPPFRGDDVADVQARLAALGFNMGRVDGIFGPATAQALRDFQADSALPADGVLGETTLAELRRVQARSGDQALVSTVRTREQLRTRPPTLKGIRIVIGEVGGMASVARALNRHLVRLGALTTTLHDPDEHAQAQAANEASADLFLALRLLPTNRGVSCAYYAGYRDESVAGRHLAELIASSAPSLLDVANLGARGMSVAILRETRMPAVLVEVGPVEVIVEGAATLADAVASALVQWVQTSSE